MGIPPLLVLFVHSLKLCSGISVQNPDRPGGGRSMPGGNMVRDLLRQAAEYVSLSLPSIVYVWRVDVVFFS